ncbi:hypothetical protein J14TS2_17160 [Bacillus sp. J14TS2]|uniref:hypothetical protein n=1 Tax=Bacillus sp. J14TS2 TaxID=2807188 RepID=UPI001B062A1C|nr:hypothetical protein [Bacillus sp. J14TS2]GIN71241.1 hypothetical protein J14TS2_17160 [Bacillus sp. J14TS2]
MGYVDIRNLSSERAWEIFNKADFKIYKQSFDIGDRVIVNDYDSYGVIIPDTAPDDLLRDIEGEITFDFDSFVHVIGAVTKGLTERVVKLEEENQKLKSKIK